MRTSTHALELIYVAIIEYNLTSAEVLDLILRLLKEERKNTNSTDTK